MNKDGLTVVLFDSSAYEEEREEAAGYMSYFPDEDTLNILKKVASNPSETEFVKAKAGESIGLIMVDLNKFYREMLDGISESARSEAIAVIKNKKPGWVVE